MEEEEAVIGLPAIMKFTGLVPIMIGMLIIIWPKNILAVGPYLSDYGLYLGLYVGVLAIIFGVTHWIVAIFVKENLHIFGRFFVIGHSLIALLEMYGWATDLIEFEPKYIFGTMFPFATAFVLLLYSLNPKKSDNVEEN